MEQFRRKITGTYLPEIAKIKGVKTVEIIFDDDENHANEKYYLRMFFENKDYSSVGVSEVEKPSIVLTKYIEETGTNEC